ncbi:Pentatricopeptide repeat-containing protein [Heracleum sosnowskyi]|uniref:Pentatricopeptide repeat-containing protein n=1 Tax=Heracleum sosnowskyi TaxID=360622 RepID=A0AAD8N2T3_9APIA|nr:Pentatricopeptide repeat-containing protein [Heracleum sosnowskyi]
MGNFKNLSSSTTHTLNANSLGFSIQEKLKLCKSLQELKQIHAFLIKTSLPIHSHPLIFTKSLSFSHGSYFSSDPTYAYSLFAKLPDPDVIAYNAIIRFFSSTKNDENALVTVLVFVEMLENGLFPDNYTYPFVLKACTRLCALKEGEQVHARVVKNGFVSDLYVVNNLMRLYAVCGGVKRMRKLFGGSTERDLVSWTTLIQGYVDMGYWKEGINVFFEMCVAGIRADEMTMVVVISAIAKLGDLSIGRKVHEYMCDRKVKFDVFVGNALVDMYLKCGSAEFARKVFNEMPDKNVVSWNSMILGLAQQGKFREAINVFSKMQSKGVKPDAVTLVGVLNSCANLGGLELGTWVHAYIDRHHLKADGFLGNALIDMYAKCGSIAKALRVFSNMKRKDVYTYSAMIVGLALNGRGERALEVFFEMRKMEVEPNDVTFIGVLMACSHAGLLEDGRKHFANMSKVFNLEPQVAHYCIMVDLLGRAGLISEAEEFIREMPIVPDASVWGALLGACRIHGHVELGKNVMEKLERIDSERDGAYVIMSNIYSSSHRWREASTLRKAMKELNIKKNPGCSLIELDAVVYEFRKGDKAHPKADVIRIKDSSGLCLSSYLSSRMA